MNKRIIVKLYKIANVIDKKGHPDLANKVDKLIKRAIFGLSKPSDFRTTVVGELIDFASDLVDMANKIKKGEDLSSDKIYEIEDILREEADTFKYYFADLAGRESEKTKGLFKSDEKDIAKMNIE